MPDLQTVGFLLTGASVSIAAIYYVLTLRSNQRNLRTNLETRQAQLFMQLYSQFHQKEFFGQLADIVTWKWKDYDDFMQKYGPKNNPDAWYSMGSVGAFFEGIGVLAYRGLIDVNLVAELMSRHIVMYWEKISPISLEIRKRMQLPVDFRLEYLYNLIKPIVERQRSEMETQHPRAEHKS
jgi:hypothetical protein